MYIPGRLRTASSPLSTWICPAPYEDAASAVLAIPYCLPERLRVPEQAPKRRSRHTLEYSSKQLCRQPSALLVNRCQNATYTRAQTGGPNGGLTPAKPTLYAAPARHCPGPPDAHSPCPQADAPASAAHSSTHASTPPRTAYRPPLSNAAQ